MSNIPKGYKQTEVGVIPVDWAVKSLLDTTPNIKNSIVDGPFGSNLKTEHYRKEGIPIITSGYVTRGTFIAENYIYVDKEKFKKEIRSAVRGGDIVFAKIGANAGASAIMPKSHEIGILSGNALKVTIDELKHSTYFIWSYLWKKYEDSGFVDMRSTGAQPALSMPLLKKMFIPVPPLSEQTAITNVLSDTESLLTSLEKLIDKKKMIRQGVMQEKLTGKRRLPGFSGEWKKLSLKRLLAIPVTDGPHLTPKFTNSGIPFLSVNNIKENMIDVSDLRFISKEDDLEFSKKCKPKKYDILLGKAATVGTVALVENNWDFNIWSPLALIRLKDGVDQKFFYYLLQTSDIYSQIKLLTNSSSQGNLGMSDIEKLEFLCPSYEEQVAISNTLSLIDSDLVFLRAKLSKLKQIKQGVMQQLLTGKIRLINK